MNPLDLITGNLWRAGTVAMGAVAAALGIALAVAHFEKVSVEHQRTALINEINDPKTGYVARLAQAETNTAQLQTAVDARDKAIADMSAADAARLADAQRQVAAAQVQSRKTQDRLAVFLAAPPKGSDVCAKSTDIDGRVVEMFR